MINTCLIQWHAQFVLVQLGWALNCREMQNEVRKLLRCTFMYAKFPSADSSSSHASLSFTNISNLSLI